MSQQSIVVSQYRNPSYNPEKPLDSDTNAPLTYYVEKTVNTLIVKIHNYLTPARVQDLIDSGVNVTVQSVKK